MFVHFISSHFCAEQNDGTSGTSLLLPPPRPRRDPLVARKTEEEEEEAERGVSWEAKRVKRKRERARRRTRRKYDRQNWGGVKVRGESRKESHEQMDGWRIEEEQSKMPHHGSWALHMHSHSWLWSHLNPKPSSSCISSSCFACSSLTDNDDEVLHAVSALCNYSPSSITPLKATNETINKWRHDDRGWGRMNKGIRQKNGRREGNKRKNQQRFSTQPRRTSKQNTPQLILFWFESSVFIPSREQSTAWKESREVPKHIKSSKETGWEEKHITHVSAQMKRAAIDESARRMCLSIHPKL